MNKKIFFGLLILISCNQHAKNDAAENLQDLSGLLTTANWRVTGDSDTSYIYFSRQMDNAYRTYEYRIIKGDSSGTRQNSISISGDSVTWTWNNRLLVLENVKGNKAGWKENLSHENFSLEKVSDSILQMKGPNVRLLFKKTLPLSTFLVRARYDYEHGTKFSDSAEVKPRNRARK